MLASCYAGDPAPLLAAVQQALEWRAPHLEAAHAEGTTCYRLFHGVGEGARGITVDRYGTVLLVQTWRGPSSPAESQGMHRFVGEVLELVQSAIHESLQPCWNHRVRPIDFEAHWPWEGHAEGLELGLRYNTTPRHRGLDPLLFLDFRAARRFVRGHSEGLRVANFFAYTAGIGLAAAAAGAASVHNIDFAASSLEVGKANLQANGLSCPTTWIQEDCLPVLRQWAGMKLKPRGRRKLPPHTKRSREQFDLVVLDPPTWATSKFGAVDIVRDYQSLFKPAWLTVADGGTLLATNHAASVDWNDWVEAMTRCAAKAGRPLSSVEPIHPEWDVPSFDGNHPLKMALVR